MTNEEYFSLFSEAMSKKKIIRYENSNSRDDYHIYAIRKTQEGYVFFCLLETFFKSGENKEGWKTGSLTSYLEFKSIKGAQATELKTSDETFVPRKDYKDKLSVLAYGESGWETVD